MKTSINVPDWLHQQVCDTDPELTFSEAVRDALLIAAPVWAKEQDRSSIERKLKMRVRMLEADAARSAVRLPERRHRGKAAGRLPAPAAPAPDARRAGRPRPAPRSATTPKASSRPVA